MTTTARPQSSQAALPDLDELTRRLLSDTPLLADTPDHLLQVVNVLTDELGASLSVVDRWGGTPLDDAIRSGHMDVVALLKARGCASAVQPAAR